MYVREIIRRAEVGQGAVQRELGRLAAVGLIIREERGNQVYYRANTEAPIYSELRAIVLKTSGLGDVLGAALEPLSGEISLAFVYGSMASGTSTAASDIDLLVVGDVSDELLHTAVEAAERVLARPVNYSLMRMTEFEERSQAGDGFLARISAGPCIPVIGELIDV